MNKGPAAQKLSQAYTVDLSRGHRLGLSNWEIEILFRQRRAIRIKYVCLKYNCWGFKMPSKLKLGNQNTKEDLLIKRNNASKTKKKGPNGNRFINDHENIIGSQSYFHVRLTDPGLVLSQKRESFNARAWINFFAGKQS